MYMQECRLAHQLELQHRSLHHSSVHPLQDLRLQLQVALGEVEDLREGRERQKEMVEAIVQQRDMYRTLLAQATPLPQESPQVR